MTLKRSSYLVHDEEIPLGTRGMTVWGYDKKRRFVCRVEINAAGLAVYAGSKGGKRLADVNWEGLVHKLNGG
jgi:hypothetical protein